MSLSRFHSLNQRLEQAAAPTGTPALYAEGLMDLPPQQWSLEIIGDPSRTWQYRDVLALPQTEQNRRLVFAEGWSYRATWRGVLLRDLLGPMPPDARYLIQQNALGQRECLPLQALLDGQAMLGLFEGNQPLPPLQGGPARLLVFDRYANYGLGQVVRLELAADPVPGHWEARGYTPDIEPGDYYAFDLQRTEAHRGTGEITQF